jgi:hypothetical protein
MKTNLPIPGSEEAAKARCDCPVSSNFNGRHEPEGGWVVRTKCVVHKDIASAVGYNEGETTVKVPSAALGWRLGVLSSGEPTVVLTRWQRMKAWFQKESPSRATVHAEFDPMSEMLRKNAEVADPAPHVHELQVVTKDAVQDSIERQQEALAKLKPYDVEEAVEATDEAESQWKLDAVKHAQDLADRADVQALVDDELARQLPAIILPRVREILSGKPPTCPGRDRHWYSLKGQPGVRSPVCIHCGYRDPRVVKELG